MKNSIPGCLFSICHVRHLFPNLAAGPIVSAIRLTSALAPGDERAREVHAEANPLSREKLLRRIDRINRMVEQIRRRGGAAVFVRFPSGGTVGELERRDWPRRRCWDILAEHTDAATIHFDDFPALPGYPMPDESHLRADAARRFTRNLVDIRVREGFLDAGEGRPSQVADHRDRVQQRPRPACRLDSLTDIGYAL